MNDNPLKQLGRLGQSVWFDNIHRDLIEDGGLRRMVDNDGLGGVTSNPTIFDKAIGGSDAYDAAIASTLAARPQLDTEDLFYEIALADIRDAADILSPVYRAAEGRDGFVSLEVSPELAHDTDASVDQALALRQRLGRDNVMIKVPATAAGLPAIETLTAAGVNVNVTLLFSRQRYRDVVEHWLRGLERRLDAGEPIAHVASVASFFVSRVDAIVDPELEAADPSVRHSLQGRAAIANAALAYRDFLDVFDGERFRALRQAGAQEQRLLWASTGTKNRQYSDVLYVSELVGARTVTTLPPDTYAAFRDHGAAEPRLEHAMSSAQRTLDDLTVAGIDLEAVTARLETDGVQAFVDSYRHLLETLDARASGIRNRTARA